MPGARGSKAGGAPAGGPARRARARKPVKSGPAGADNSREALAGDIEMADLRRLIRLVQKTGIGELEVSTGGRTVRIASQAGVAPVSTATLAAPHPAPSAAASGASPAGSPGATGNQVVITSPMVGTFYRAPAPDAEPYVEVGDVVEVGQTVCIVEAMKLMNEIESEVKGRIVRILVENAQPVEYGQKLFLIEPL